MGVEVFRPRYRVSAYISLSIGLCLFAWIMKDLILAFGEWNKIGTWEHIILVFVFLLLLILIILTILLMIYYKTMRYEFRDDGLYLIIGPFKDRIDYKDIVKWEKRDLEFNPLSSLRMPGLALFNVYYSYEGKVRMYATSAGSNVLLIRTKKKKYGITPAPEDFNRFIEELKRRVEKYNHK